MWVGTPSNGILHFTTYSYADVNKGSGQTNEIRNV